MNHNDRKGTSPGIGGAVQATHHPDLAGPAAPTPALPGTPARVAVLCERARQHVQLFHPDDAGGWFRLAF